MDATLRGCKEFVFVGKASSGFVDRAFDSCFEEVKSSGMSLSAVESEDTEDLLGVLLVALLSPKLQEIDDVLVAMLGNWNCAEIGESLSKSLVIASAVS